MDEFPFEVELETRFRDVDAMGHVNNAVYATYLEQARVTYLAEVGDTELEEVGIVLADLTIDYRRPIEFGQTVTVGIRAADVGTTSLNFEYEIRADDEVVATAESTTVRVDRDSGESVPIPGEWRDRFEATTNGDR